MTDQVTLFDDSNNNEPEPIDETKDWAEELVGEGKKYKDFGALAKGAVHKDAHIARLERENATLREEIRKRATLDEVMDRITAANKPGEMQTPQDAGVRDAQPTQGLTPEQVEQLVAKQLQAKAEEATRRKNAQVVKDELTKRFGAGYSNHLRARAQQLGVSPEYLDRLAVESPQVLLDLVGQPSNRQPDNFAPPSSAAQPNRVPSGGKNFAYYQKMMREDNRRFNSPEVQVEMAQEALRQGPSFYQN